MVLFTFPTMSDLGRHGLLRLSGLSIAQRPSEPSHWQTTDVTSLHQVILAMCDRAPSRPGDFRES